MTKESLDALLSKASRGELSPDDQNTLAQECAIYRAMALRLERCVHDLIKETEHA